MPEELQDRFKALKSLFDQCEQIDEDRDNQFHNLEVLFEKLYSDIYR